MSTAPWMMADIVMVDIVLPIARVPPMGKGPTVSVRGSQTDSAWYADDAAYRNAGLDKILRDAASRLRRRLAVVLTVRAHRLSATRGP